MDRTKPRRSSRSRSRDRVGTDDARAPARPRRRSRSRSRSRGRSRDRSRSRERGGSGAARPVDPVKRRIQPNQGILGSILRQHIRNNDRMDQEEVARATQLLRRIDPTTTRSAQLMSSHLSAPDTFIDTEAAYCTQTAAVLDTRAAMLRASAVVGGVSLTDMPRLPPPSLVPAPPSGVGASSSSSWKPVAAGPPKPSESERSAGRSSRRVSVSPEREVVCPYDPSHRLPHQSLKNHLTKCPKRPVG